MGFDKTRLEVQRLRNKRASFMQRPSGDRMPIEAGNLEANVELRNWTDPQPIDFESIIDAETDRVQAESDPDR